MPACVGRHVHSDDSAVHRLHSDAEIVFRSSFIADCKRPIAGGSFVGFARETVKRSAMSRDSSTSDQDAMRCAGAREHSPFLRDSIMARPEIAEAFAEARRGRRGYDSPCRRRATIFRATLRRQRQGLALAVALGDLSGELPLEQVTRLLSDFADSAIDRGGRARRSASGCRMPSREVSRSSPWASSAATSSIIPPTSICCCCSTPKPCRGAAATMPGEAAVRIGRRLIELLQKRTEDGYVQRVDLRLRPSPEVTPIALPVNAAISHYESSALPWERAAFIRARAAAGDLRSAAIPRRDPAVRLAPLARFRRDRGGPPDLGADPRPFRSRRAYRPGLSTSSAAAAESARSNSSSRFSR